MLFYLAKTLWIWLRILRWKDCPDYLGGLYLYSQIPSWKQVSRKLDTRRREGNVKMEHKDFWRCWLWRWEGWGHKSRNAGNHQKVKDIGNSSPRKPSVGVWPCPNLDFSWGKPILEFHGLHNYEKTHFYCFSPPSLW